MYLSDSEKRLFQMVREENLDGFIEIFNKFKINPNLKDKVYTPIQNNLFIIIIFILKKQF